MEHLHEPEIDPLDIDKPGYYTPTGVEIFSGIEIERLNDDGTWSTSFLGLGTWGGSIRIKYLQAKDIVELGFARVSPGIPMYQRGSYTITAFRLLDPTYSRIKVSQNGIIVFEGHVKNKSELKRILILNEINFAD